MQESLKFAISMSLLASGSILPAQDVQITPLSFPEGFRGKVVYDGILKGTAVVAPQGGAGININGGNVQLDLGGLFNRALNKRTVPLHGTWHVEAEYEGNTVRGRSVVQSDIDGLSENVGFVGTRNGDICDLSFEGQAPLRITCTPIRFESNVDYTNESRQKIKASYIASRTSAVDYVERDRLAAIEQAKREREAAEARRAEAAEVARIAALPRATPAQIRLLADAIGQDSGSWSYNRYDVGSLKNVRVDASGGVTALRGDYTYNGGSFGWIKGQIGQGRVQCIQYHDTTGCAAVRQSVYRSGNDVIETIKIENYRWALLDRRNFADGSKSLTAVTDIRKKGSIVSYLEYNGGKETNGKIKRAFVVKMELDCSKPYGEDKLIGYVDPDGTVSLVKSIGLVNPALSGTREGENKEKICSGKEMTNINSLIDAVKKM